MGKFLNKFKKTTGKINEEVNSIAEKRRNTPKSFRGGKIREQESGTIGSGIADSMENYEDDGLDYDDYDDDSVNIMQAQKPESFHHFILENKYKDIERSIRGFKDVYNKETREWEVKRKKEHCFTDEEAEDILRTAQSHLSTDIKLSTINIDAYGPMMMALYKRIDGLFYSISEYRYGRYNKFDKNGKLLEINYNKQYDMKLQNRKIFLELWTRIQANYSMAIAGSENKSTHSAVKGQESLQQTDRDDDFSRRLT